MSPTMGLTSEDQIIKSAEKKYASDSAKLDLEQRVDRKKSNIDTVRHKVYLRNKSYHVLAEYYFDFNGIYTEVEWNNGKANETQYEKARPRAAQSSFLKAFLILLYYLVGFIVAISVGSAIDSLFGMILILFALIVIQQLFFK